MDHLKQPIRLPAFTLIELIVSMLIFSVFIGVASTSYLFLSRALRQAADERKVYSELRFVLDQFTHDVRNMTVDYACLEDLLDGTLDQSSVQWQECSISFANGGSTSVVPLISSDGLQRIVYRFAENQFSILKLAWVEDTSSWQAVEGYWNGFQPFEMDHVQWIGVQFYVAPLASPYVHFEDEFQYQPSVHVVMAAQSRSEQIDRVPIQLQSTISSRVYSVLF